MISTLSKDRVAQGAGEAAGSRFGPPPPPWDSGSQNSEGRPLYMYDSSLCLFLDYLAWHSRIIVRKHGRIAKMGYNGKLRDKTGYNNQTFVSFSNRK